MSGIVPIVAEADVIVSGGELGGVAAACAAARAGARVFLASVETYLGADLCATGRLWSGRTAAAAVPLARKLFFREDGSRRPSVRPMDVKRLLETELLEAGVVFRFGCVPADLLVDADGRLAGVVFASKSGLVAVRGRAVVDASFSARLARAAGLRFVRAAAGDTEFRQVVLGHRAAGDKGRTGRSLGPVIGSETEAWAPAEAFEYRFRLPVPAWTPDAVAAVEQRIRDKVWHRDQNWIADRPWYVPPVALAAKRPADALAGTAPFATARAGLWVVGPCAAVTRPLARRLLDPGPALEAGARVGQAAAGQAAAVTLRGRVRGLHPPADRNCREPCTCDRSLRARERIAGGAGGLLPELGRFDVVVAGGGTAGAPAAIAAARAGARVLLLETLPELGGVMTAGMIACYYHGYREGFTAEVTRKLEQMTEGQPFHPERWNPLHKAELFRRELLAAGGTVWFGATVSGAVTGGARRTAGVVVNTPWARGIVRAGVVIDATGNADVAAAAGAPCVTVSAADLAVQGAGLAVRPWAPRYCNSDYTFADDSDLLDATRVFVMARRKFAAQFDLTQLIDSRERRQIVGEVTVSVRDAYLGRTWRDTLCLSRSNFDSHGFTVDPLFLVMPPDRASIDAWVPLRALLPRGWEGLLVTGLAISAHRDVMPVLRMQPDVQNQAYAAGLTAAAAVRDAGGRIRAVDLRAIQRQLAAKDRLLPPTVLLHGDGVPSGAERLAQAAAGPLALHAELALLLNDPARARPLLRKRLAAERDPDQRLRCARLLAVLGDAAGEALLIRALRGAWDEGWNYTGMGQFGRSLSPQDDCIVCLARLRSTRARAAVLRKAARLTPGDAFSHVRAVALYCEAVGGAACARALARLLALPGVHGHAWTRIEEELADIPQSDVDTGTRNRALRELHLARALLRCGDPQGLGRAILARYADDLRGHFARHAAGLLAGAGKSEPGGARKGSRFRPRV